LNIEAKRNSMPKVETDNLSFDIPKPTQVAPTQNERAAFQMTKEEGA